MTNIAVTAGDRIRVAYGVFGRTGVVRSTMAGHILVHYDDGSRELVDRTRRGISCMSGSERR